MNRMLAALVGCSIFIAFGDARAADAVSEMAAIEYYQEGIKAQQAGNPVGAEVAYRKFIVLAPKDTEHRKMILNNMGIIYAQQGELDKAEEAFREVLNIDPAFTAAKMNLGLIYDARGNEIRALQYWARAFELDKMKPAAFIIADAPPAAEQPVGK